MLRTVLIVDDHAGFRASVRRLLEADGYEVIGEAANGGEAVKAAATLVPDLVLLDVSLPDVDGFEVARRLSSTDGGPQIVLTSSRDWSTLPDLIASSGARGFVSKDDLSGSALAALTA